MFRFRTKEDLLLSLFVLNNLVFIASPLKCFQCSEHPGSSIQLKCPTSSDVSSKWAQNSQLYLDFGNASTTFCALRITGAGAVFYQSGVPSSSCTDPSIIQYIIGLVNTDSGVAGAQFACCNTDGCNWNLTTTQSNTPLNAQSQFSSSYVPYILGALLLLALIGLLVLLVASLICNGCCAACFAAKKKGNASPREYKDAAVPIIAATQPKPKTNAINLNDRYKYVQRADKESVPTPVEDKQKNVGPTRVPAINTIETIPVEEKVKEPHPALVPSAGPQRPVGPKPAKAVDADAINLSAFVHFAPKSTKSK